LPPLAVTIWLLAQSIPISQGSVLTESYAWAPALGMEFSLRLDGLGLLFGLVIAGIGTGIALYTGYYFEKQSDQGYFYFLLFLFMTSMLGVVWSDNLLLLFVFWEGTSITSYLLIGFRTQDKKAMAGARTAFVVTGVGALAMLGGFVLLGQNAGTYAISELLAMPDLMNIAYAPTILILIFLGAFSKSAQFPFQFWLPGAMAAPTPASAYLHSATMVKAGVYLLARLHPAFAHSPLWFWSLLTVGGFTMILGSVSAFRYYDLKKMLAYATVSFLGLLVMLLAFDSEIAYAAVAVGILAHGLYKGPLFMMAGIIDHATGTRDIRKLAGLWRPLPWVTLLGVIAGLSLSGLPPFLGFVAKEGLLEATSEFAQHAGGGVAWTNFILSVVTGAFYAGLGFTLIWEMLLRKRASDEPAAEVHHKPSFAFVFPALALASLGIILPFTLTWLSAYIIDPAADAIAGSDLHIHLALWHGFTPLFMTSLVALTLGAIIFLFRKQVRAVFRYAPEWLSSSVAFDWIDKGVYTLAGWSTRTVQGGTLATQVGIVMLAGMSVLVYAMLSTDMLGILRLDVSFTPTLRLYEIITTLLIIVSAIVTMRARTRLTAIISIGVVGVGVTLYYVFYSAPDLALTQLLIEVLTVVLLILVFYRIPPERDPTPPPKRVRRLYGTIALLAGLFGFIMAIVASSDPYAPTISDFFLKYSVSGGHGANVVNVILVDFRGYDTMGEITVLAIAALGGYALLRSPRLRPLNQDPRMGADPPPAPPESATADVEIEEEGGAQ
jgi:multicomponent Na+:H+ antiporter subunit A